ncbi:MAG: Rieske 2Fe-2S domain-containing protein [Deltaproteobacteria bacterium]|nr:Rieske 2Fe-2S domain-containing protein [Deltaproteobacteria bacterium]
MRRERSQKGKVVAQSDELLRGTTKKFRIRCRGFTLEGFLVNYEGKLFAYVNRCCHMPISMDWVENRFFTEDKRYLICANHGAVYEPTTGECIGGPCYGASLQEIPLEIQEGTVRAFCPEDGL